MGYISNAFHFLSYKQTANYFYENYLATIDIQSITAVKSWLSGCLIWIENEPLLSWFNNCKNSFEIWIEVKYALCYQLNANFKTPKLIEVVFLKNRMKCLTIMSIWVNCIEYLIIVLYWIFLSFLNKIVFWTRRDLNTQPSDLESDALPLRHEFLLHFEILYIIFSKNSVKKHWSGA